MTGQTGISEGSVEANGLSFGYLAAGERGPLALCLHGFPDTAWTWRHLLPELATAGFRAVAPWLRGYAPSQVPEEGHYDVGTLALDANALHEAFGGDDEAVLVGHDWGALIGYSATQAADQARWRRLAALAVPPPAAVAGAFFSYDQLRRSWYMFFFQHPLSDAAVGQGGLEFVERLWADWSPGYDATQDLSHVKESLGDSANLAAALGYYRATLGNIGVNTDPAAAALQAVATGPVGLPTLYLHGRTDGCMGAELAEAAGSFLSHADSRVELVDDAGHFLHLERPTEVNRLIIDFLRG
jgi:pimeloyl-ACP methyl ester carboxylesterase